MTQSTEDLIRQVLTTHKRIAVVGASSTPGKPAHDVPLLMRERGYDIVAVNPTITEWEGQAAYASLGDVPGPIDIVNVFRPASETPAIARAAVQVGAKVLWLQLGITNQEAQAIARQAGLWFVEDRCVNVEYKRLRDERVPFPNLGA